MGVDYYTCDICAEIHSYDFMLYNLKECCTCDNSVNLSEEEYIIFDSINWCTHTLCIVCSPFLDVEEPYRDIIKIFKNVLEEVRKDREYIKKFEQAMKCRKCIQEENEQKY